MARFPTRLLLARVRLLRPGGLLGAAELAPGLLTRVLGCIQQSVSLASASIASGGVRLAGLIIRSSPPARHQTTMKPPHIHYIRWIPGPTWIAGQTIPPIGIFIEKAYMSDPVLHYHELWHWKQAETLGLFKFYVAYTFELIWRGYRRNAFEAEAYRVSAGKTWFDVDELEATL